jgi:cell division transport system permease protein
MKHFMMTHLHIAKTALINLFKQPLGTILTLLMLAIAMTLPLTLYLGLQNSAPLLGKLGEAPQVTMFLEVSADDVDTATIKANLEKRDDLAKIELVSKNEALAHLQMQLGQENLLSLVEENPLPDAFVLTPKNSDPETLKKIQSELSGLPMVEEVQIDTQWAQTLFHIVAAIEKVTWFLGMTLSLAFILVMYNTIRLQILSQKEAIEITRLLGAPASFIHRPFLYQAFWQGLFASLMALVLGNWIISHAQPLLGNILTQYGLNLNFRFFNLEEISVTIIVMVILAILGAFLATRNHLKHFKARA